jgi:hypothetical protein
MLRSSTAAWVRTGWIGWVASLGTLSGCVSSSIGDDVRFVQDATAVEQLPRVADRDVEPVAAQDVDRLLAEPLDAEGAVRVALLDNRELRARLREIGIARGQWLQAGLLPNPRAEAELLPERNSRVELRLEYDLTRAVLAPLAARAAAPDLEAARSRAAAAVVSLGYRVRAQFYRLQAAEQGLASSQRGLDALAARHDVARALVEAGNVAELELAREEAAYERARVDVARRELDVASGCSGCTARPPPGVYAALCRPLPSRPCSARTWSAARWRRTWRCGSVASGSRRSRAAPVGRELPVGSPTSRWTCTGCTVIPTTAPVHPMPTGVLALG